MPNDVCHTMFVNIINHILPYVVDFMFWKDNVGLINSAFY